MHSRLTPPRRGFALVALTAVVALSLVASAADAAGPGRGRSKHKRKHKRHHERVVVRHERWREPRHVVVSRPVRVVRAEPAWAACPPRYVSYRPQRVVVVRPAPYVRVGGRIGSVNISAIFGPRRQYSDYEYGCNFCEAHFGSFAAYDSHVHGCSHRPQDVRIQARHWDDAGYDEWDGRDACSTDRRYADGRWDDERYDRRDDDWYED
jgi:hypothetical protein